MARELIWRRNAIEFADNDEINLHVVQGPFLNPGETLTRLRLSWVAYHTAGFPADGVGFAVVFGAIMTPDSTLPNDVPRPLTNANDDWIWWEGGFMKPLAVKSDATNAVNEIDVSPPDAGRERDVKAQRLSTTVGGDRVWFVTENSTLSVGQSDHWLSVSYSAGILLPAT